MQQEDAREQAATQARCEEAALLLCTARLQRQRLDRLPQSCRPASEVEAYAVQDLLHRCLAARQWGTIAGHKIGCTTPVMQAYLGIHNPAAGGVFDTTVQHGPGRRQLPHDIRVGVECEIAVHLGNDLLPAAAPFGRADVAAAVDGCMAAIEIVEDRYTDYPSLDTPTLLADDFFGAGCVLGGLAVGFDPGDLVRVTATMAINGRHVGAGIGSDVQGNPLDALVWLANNTAARGIGLRAGEFVLLGSLVQTHWVERGDRVVIVNEPLGEVHASFV